jgi:signal peptidase I
MVTVAVALVAALLIKTFVLQPFFIPSGSMEPTLFPGDRVLVVKVHPDYHVGDVVVFHRPPLYHGSDTDLIKRIVATGGQTVFVANCRVYVDGKELAQPYLPSGWQNPSSEYCTQWYDGPNTVNLPNPYKIPAGEYFLMGDNRSGSDDSRFWGPLPASYVIGQASVRIWPPDRLGFF